MCVCVRVPGLAGKAATTGEDVVSNDAQNDENFLARVDKATSYVTKSILCAVLKEEGSGEVRAIVQLINKKGSEPGSFDGAFDDADMEAVRKEGPTILGTCAGVSLHQLLTSKRDDSAPYPVGEGVPRAKTPEMGC